MKCGIVILNYNDFTATEELLSRIQDSSEIDSIVIVDNNSHNESYTLLKKHESQKISVIQSGRNGGYSFGNNAGVRYLLENSRPDIIGIANPDTEFDGSFVRRIKEVFAAAPEYAVLSGFQLKPSGENGGHPFWEQDTVKSKLFDALKGAMIRPFRVILDKLFPNRDYVQYVEAVRHSRNIPHQVWAVEGSLFFIRTEDFVKMGMFDENVFMFYEESIIAVKLQELGRKTGIINDISFVHAHKAPEPSSAGFERRMSVFYASDDYYSRVYIFRGRKLLYALYVFLKYAGILKGKISRYVKRYFTASNTKR